MFGTHARTGQITETADGWQMVIRCSGTSSWNVDDDDLPRPCSWFKYTGAIPCQGTYEDVQSVSKVRSLEYENQGRNQLSRLPGKCRLKRCMCVYVYTCDIKTANAPISRRVTEAKAQYTPPTPTRRNCRVASRCVGSVYTNSQLVGDSFVVSSVWTHPSAVVTHWLQNNVNWPPTAVLCVRIQSSRIHVHTADADETRQNSFVSSASVVCIGLNEPTKWWANCGNKKLRRLTDNLTAASNTHVFYCFKKTWNKRHWAA